MDKISTRSYHTKIMAKDETIISQEVLDDIAFRAKITISPEQSNDFRSSLTSIVKMFHKMSQVSVCEFKQYGVTPTQYKDLREDKPAPCPSHVALANSFAHFNSATGYFEVPKVIDEE